METHPTPAFALITSRGFTGWLAGAAQATFGGVGTQAPVAVRIKGGTTPRIGGLCRGPVVQGPPPMAYPLARAIRAGPVPHRRATAADPA